MKYFPFVGPMTVDNMSIGFVLALLTTLRSDLLLSAYVTSQR